MRLRPIAASLRSGTFRLFPIDGSVVVLSGVTYTQARAALAEACNVKPAALARARYIRSESGEQFRFPHGIAALRCIEAEIESHRQSARDHAVLDRPHLAARHRESAKALAAQV